MPVCVAAVMVVKFSFNLCKSFVSGHSNELLITHGREKVSFCNVRNFLGARFTKCALFIVKLNVKRPL